MPRYLTIALFAALLLSGCAKSGTDPQAAALAKKYGLPATISKIDGWHGVHIVRSVAYGTPQCSADFPKTFGRTTAERGLLNYIISYRPQLADSVSCDITLLFYKSLDQLKLLATQEQDRQAAQLLVAWGSPDMPFDLDGEAAEGYTESYLLPVLEKSRHLRSILDAKQEKNIATDVCGDLSWRQDVGDVKTKERVERLLAHLRHTGAAGLAEEIVQSCASMKVPFSREFRH